MGVRDKLFSKLPKRLLYWKDRFGNAVWMLRPGRFKLFFRSIYIELYPAVERVRTQLHMEDRQVPDSAFVDKRKVARPGYRPTVSQLSPVALNQDKALIVAEELRQILLTLNLEDDPIP